MNNPIEQERIKQVLTDFYPQFYQNDLVEDIVKLGKIYSFKAGEIIMDYGGYIKMFPLVFDGSIKVMRVNEEGNEIFLYYLMPGDSCASSFSCCMIQKRSIIQTCAEEDVSFIGIPIAKADEWMGKYPLWRNFIFRMFDDRIMGLIDIVDVIAFSKMDDRLIDYLDKKSLATNSNTIKATHQEIATDLNASREAVSRLLKSMEKQGKLKLGRNAIEILY